MQCYVYFAGRGVKASTKLLSDADPEWAGAHFGDAHGCPVTAGTYDTFRAYCNKTVEHINQQEWAKVLVEGTAPFEYGVYESGKPGVKKATLESFREELLSGKTLPDLVMEGKMSLDLLSRHLGLVKVLSGMNQPERNLEKVRVILLIGEANTGKSYWAKANFPDAYKFPLNNGASATWCGPDLAKAKAIIFNDFYGQGIVPEALLNICSGDAFSFRMPGGSEVPILADTLIITSNAEPRNWYSGLKEKKPEAWQRWYEAFMSRCCVPGERPDDVYGGTWTARGWGERPNFIKWLADKKAADARTAALEARLAAAGGITVTLDGQTMHGPHAPAPVRAPIGSQQAVTDALAEATRSIASEQFYSGPMRDEGPHYSDSDVHDSQQDSQYTRARKRARLIESDSE